MFDFSVIKGNEGLITHMKNVLHNGRVSHAYIFEGSAGTGKKLAAKTFAKGLQCESEHTKPCNSCISCRTFETNNHPDIIYVSPVKTKSIGVDDVREQVNKNMEVKPYLYRYKIFIIDHADTMTIAAQNALLKTIEEPASYGIFLLLSANKSHLLPTILSRCVMLRLKPLPDMVIKECLIENGQSPSDADKAFVYAGGNMGRAIQLVTDEDFKAMRARIVDIMAGISTMDMVDVFGLFSVFEGFKENIQELLDIIVMWYRDCIVIKETGNNKFLMQKDISDRIIKEAESIDIKALYYKLDAVLQARQRLLLNSNFHMTMDVMIMKLRGAG